MWVWRRCEVSARQGVEGRCTRERIGADAGARRQDRSAGGGTARVAEWRRVGAKRVLGDVGRGGGVPAEDGRSEADRMSAGMSGDCSRHYGVSPGSGEKRGVTPPKRRDP